MKIDIFFILGRCLFLKLYNSKKKCNNQNQKLIKKNVKKCRNQIWSRIVHFYYIISFQQITKKLEWIHWYILLTSWLGTFCIYRSILKEKSWNAKMSRIVTIREKVQKPKKSENENKTNNFFAWKKSNYKMPKKCHKFKNLLPNGKKFENSQKIKEF